MKIYSRLVTAFATVAALANVTPAWAQDHLIARVPFAFSVGNASMPLDTYRLSRMDGHPEMLFLRGDRTGTFVRTNETALPRRNDDAPSLVFHKYGDQYFLREVRWTGSARLDLPETKAERVAAERRSDGAAALPEKVVIVAGLR